MAPFAACEAVAAVCVQTDSLRFDKLKNIVR